MPEPHYVSVDIETAGPAPGRFALLSIGACLVGDPDVGFYVELQPDRDEFDAEALTVSGLSLETLAETGVPAAEAMEHLAGWLHEVTEGRRPVFVAFNAAFDWLFVADYFDRYLGHNPFGHSAIDIKAMFMGATGRSWSRTSFGDVAGYYGVSAELPHHALEDARIQARLFARILGEGPSSEEHEEDAQ